MNLNPPKTTKDFWFPFYPDTWTGDPELQSCNENVKGAMIQLMCIMAKSSKFGYLLISGKIPTDKEVATFTRIILKKYIKYKNILLNKKILKRNNKGIIYSKRMVEDFEKREHFRCVGKLGGNPALLGLDKGKVNPKDKGKVNPKDKTIVTVIFKDINTKYYKIYTCWNSQKVIVHDNPTKEIKNAIDKATKKGFTVSQITQAITNYGRVIADPVKYWYNTKWTLESFLNRGLKEDKFLDWDIAVHNFSRNSIPIKPQKPEGQKAVKPKYKGLVWKG